MSGFCVTIAVVYVSASAMRHFLSHAFAFGLCVSTTVTGRATSPCS
jgi:hypothetical protein